MSNYRLLAFILLTTLSYFSIAHEQGVTDTHIKLGASKVQVIYTLPDNDLSEEQTSLNPINKDLLSRFSIISNNRICPIEHAESKLLKKIRSHQFIFLYDCKKRIDKLAISYNFNFSERPDHQNISHIQLAGRTQTFSFHQEHYFHELDIGMLLKLWSVQLSNDDLVKSQNQATENFFNSGKPYFKLGMEHILIGYDHILFLLGLLLLPFKLKELIWLITSFTLAHSITLGLSVLNVVNIDSHIIEALIALSIIYIGLENIWVINQHKLGITSRSLWKRRMMITFSFGLIHGFGFSFILKEIGLSGSITAPLLFFNLGVEAGQLIIVMVLLPVLIKLFSKNRTPKITCAASLIIAIIGSYWLIERISQ